MVMIMKKIVSFILAVVLCFATPTVAYGAQVDDKNINAKSAILMCMDTGDVLYSYNEHEHLSPASVTKIMSLLLVLEAVESGKISLKDMVTASKNAVAMGGSQIWLEVGEQMTVEELLKAVIVASANDACTALGEYVGGSVAGFVRMMNDRARELGLENTSFENCTGLDDDVVNHYSCAYDLAIIATQVMRHEIVTKYSTIWLDSLRNGETELNNTNKLVNTYEGITGLKTGTTSNAGFCLCATACRENMGLVAVVLGSETSTQRFDTASYLLDYGYANYKIVCPEIDKSKLTPVKVKLGEQKSITPYVDSDVKLCLEKGETELQYKYSIKKQLNAPVKKGTRLGTIRIIADKKEIGTIAAVANKYIGRISVKDIFRRLITNI